MDLTSQAQGWAPESYLEQITTAAPAAPAQPPVAPSRPAGAPSSRTNGAAAAAKAKAKPAPPPRPAKRPGVGGKPVAAAAAAGISTRDSAVSMNSTAQDSSGGSRSATPSSLAGGLAEALKSRHQHMNPKEEDEEEDW